MANLPKTESMPAKPLRTGHALAMALLLGATALPIPLTAAEPPEPAAIHRAIGRPVGLALFPQGTPAELALATAAAAERITVFIQAQDDTTLARLRARADALGLLNRRIAV